MIIDEFKKLGIEIPSVLLPQKDIDLSKWAVVACDQYTSQPVYWDTVEEIVGDKPSTLRVIFPEVYLEDEGRDNRIEKINSTMKKYLEENLLVPQNRGVILVDRKTSHTKSRKGLMVSLDLEQYDFNKGSQTIIRATEGTVIDRLPPRIRVRENASIELPHIMVLIDDPQKSVIEPISQKLSELKKIYDTHLMMNGGHISGYMIDSEEMLNSILKALQALADRQAFQSKYDVAGDKELLLFAVGDGNHSLASAKGHWENVKKGLSIEDQSKHPARYALVELVNVHDEGLNFEPIHRVVFNIDPEDLLNNMVKNFENDGCKTELRFFKTRKDMQNKIASSVINKSHSVAFVTHDTFGTITVNSPRCTLEVGTLQSFLEEYASKDSNIRIDYIHGDEVVENLGSEKGNIGFYLPSMDKNDLFKTVIKDGVLPKKTFSMGEAEEKRFYLESRKIVL